jgi:hypothetical protein
MPASKNVTRILSSASVMCSDVPGKAAQLIYSKSWLGLV